MTADDPAADDRQRLLPRPVPPPAAVQQPVLESLAAAARVDGRRRRHGPPPPRPPPAPATAAARTAMANTGPLGNPGAQPAPGGLVVCPEVIGIISQRSAAARQPVASLVEARPGPACAARCHHGLAGCPHRPVHRTVPLAQTAAPGGMARGASGLAARPSSSGRRPAARYRRRPRGRPSCSPRRGRPAPRSRPAAEPRRPSRFLRSSAVWLNRPASPPRSASAARPGARDGPAPASQSAAGARPRGRRGTGLVRLAVPLGRPGRA